MKMLVELIALNPELMSGKFTASFTQRVAKEMWEEIACKLNALPGADKSWEKWKKAWQDTKNTAKTKAAAIQRHSRGIGGGPPCNISLTEVQSDAIAQISEVAITGHKTSHESIVEMSFNNNTTNVYNSQLIDDENIEVIMGDDSDFFNCPESEVKETFETSCGQPNQISTNDPKLSKHRFVDTNSATIRLGDLAEKKFEIKEAYYLEKLRIMQDQCDT
ncbi:hypothetical protein ACI65C_013328 [Semiaphis heraclei]